MTSPILLAALRHSYEPSPQVGALLLQKKGDVAAAIPEGTVSRTIVPVSKTALDWV